MNVYSYNLNSTFFNNTSWMSPIVFFYSIPRILSEYVFNLTSIYIRNYNLYF